MPPCANYSLENISSQLCDFLQKNILAPEVEVTAETELTTIGVDSFSLMELVLFIERRFGLILPPDSLTAENISSVKTLSNYCMTLANQTND
ncbi:MAG: acyl carrier protein [Methylococcaceae bacterium]